MRAALLGYLDLVCGDHVDGTGAGNCMEKERERLGLSAGNGHSEMCVKYSIIHTQGSVSAKILLLVETYTHSPVMYILLSRTIIRTIIQS